jgi:hypothetical protein
MTSAKEHALLFLESEFDSSHSTDGILHLN